MNIRDDHKLEKLLNTLKFSQKNLEIALKYLNSENETDSLLAQAEHQNFRALHNNEQSAAWVHLHWVLAHDRPKMRRYLKLFFAIGQSTTAALWRPYSQFAIHKEQQTKWLIEVLSPEAAVAIEADAIAWNRRQTSVLTWLHQLAKTVPQVLVAAQSLCGTEADNAKIVLAGILLCECDDEEILAQQKLLLLQNNMDTLDSLAPGLTAQQLLVLRRYMKDGAHAPQLPGGLYVPTAADAIQNRNADGYLCGLLGQASFEAIGVDSHARCALQIYLNLNPEAVLNSITKLGRLEYFKNHLDELMEDLPGGAATMLLYLCCGRYWIDDETRKMLMQQCRKGLKEAMDVANTSQYQAIIQDMPAAMNLLGGEKQRIITLLQRSAKSGQQVIADYLSGFGSLENSRRELAGAGSGWVYPSQAASLAMLYRLDHGWDEFVCRCAVVLGMVFEGRTLGNMIAQVDREQATFVANKIVALVLNKFDLDQMEQMVRELTGRGLPLVEAMNMVGYLHEETFNEAAQKQIQARLYLTVAKPELIPSLSEVVKSGSVFTRQTAVNALYQLASEYPEAKSGLLAAAGDSSKQIKNSLLTLFTGRPEWVGDYQTLLTSKKAAVRQLAVEVLGRLGEREALEAALPGEKNAKVADAIRAILGTQAAPVTGGAADLAAELVKGNKLKKLSWLLSDSLQKLRSADGIPADDTIRNAILLSYCELGRIGRSDTAAELAKGLDQSDLQKLAVQVYDIWFAAGAQAKHKWVLAFAAVFGGAAMTQRLSKAIHDWPEHQRGAIACDAVMALALSSDPAAIVIVDAISRKFKFRQVKQAAAAALENAAQELGISAEELADRIVPDLGFAKDGTRVFDYGKRSFTVRLTPTLELSITNDQGKTVKNIPAPGKTDEPQAADAYEAFKTMKKQIKTTVTAQRARLEAALSVLRCWDTDRWQALFVDNPIMHQFAMSLIWGIYENGKLTETFRYMEDGSFNTVDEDEFELPEKAKIGLVHPVELDADTLDGWKQQLEDYEIKQSIDQLGRTIHALEETKAGEKALEDFGGKRLNGLSLSGKLLQQGWYRGSIVDGGMYYTFFREDATVGLGVELRFSGSGVGYADDDDVTVYDAIFYTGTIHRGSYVYDSVPKENIVPLGDVPARYYSEIIHQFTRATASSTETDENWRESRNDQ